MSNNKLYRNFGPTSLAVDNSTSIILFMLMLLLFGMRSYNTMPKEQFPEIVIPTINVVTTYSGNSAEDMETLVTTKLEKEIATVTGIKKLESTSISDFSMVTAEFNTSVDVDKALRDVKDAVDKAKSDKDFPKDLTAGPNVFEINFSEFPIMTVNVSGSYSDDELRGYGEYLQDEIEKIKEISEVKLKGTASREVKIDLDWAEMQSRMVSYDDVINAIRSENMTLSAGERKTNGFRRSVRVVGEFQNVEQIKNLIIKSEFQNAIFLKDIATVYEGFAEPTSIARSDGFPVVSLDIIKRAGENLLSAADQVNEIVERAQKKRFPKDLKVSIFGDQSINTRDQVANLQNSIISGVLLVVMVLLFFLGTRNSMFVGIAIPLSMLMGILILNVMGITLNIVVLFSLILSLGLLVDNSIVVVENIYRYMQEGYSHEEASKKGAAEVAMPIISSTATTLAAFLPLMFWPGIMGSFMGYLPLTLIIVLSSSLFVALVITPVLTSKYMRLEEAQQKAGKRDLWKRQMINTLIFAGVVLVLMILAYLRGTMWLGNMLAITAGTSLLNFFVLKPASSFFQNKLLPVLETIYDAVIRFILRGVTPIILFVAVFGLLFLSIQLLGIFAPKTIFFPAGDPLYVNAFVDLPMGSDIQETNKITRKLEKKIEGAVASYRDLGVVESVLSQIGENTADPASPPEPGATPNKARLTVSFVPANERGGVSTLKIMNAIRDSLRGYAGLEIVVDRNAEGPPTGKPINLEISGDDKEMQELSVVSGEVFNYLKAANVPGVEELKMNIEPNVLQDIVQIDREAARRYGLSTSAIATSLRTSLYGTEAGQLKKGEDEYPIMVRLKEEYRRDKDKLMNQMVTFRNMDAGGRIVQIPISSVANIYTTSTYNAIKRKNEKRTITIYSNILEGYNPNEVVEQIKAVMYNYELPEDYTYKFTGEQEEQAENMEFLSTAFMIAIFSIFLIIVTQFNSLSTPIIIVFSILFSTIGVFLGYVFTQMDFVIIMTGIGIISLAGVVVNNAIVLIDYTDFLRNRTKEQTGRDILTDEEVKAAIVQGGKTRLRPVLLTAITTVLGLIPLAIGFNFDFVSFISTWNPNIFIGGDNAAVWGPMAWTVVFGLIFATFLTLVVVPVMYWLMYKINSFFARLFGFKK